MAAANPTQPPHDHAALLKWALPPGIRRESIIGDLYEEFAARVEAGSLAEARRWYRRQVRRVVAEYFFTRRIRTAGHGIDGHVQSGNRRRRGDGFMNTLLRDLRFAVRSFGRTPGFTAVAVLTIALGVGANAAIFSVVNGVILRPLPYPEPDRVVRPWAEKFFSRPMFLEFREQTTSFSHAALSGGPSLTFTEGDAPEVINGGQVTAEFFGALGATPLMGRTFRAEEQHPGAEPVVVLSYDFWQSRFGGDTGILGRRIGMEGLGADYRTVIGVMPQTHRRRSSGWQVWVPFTIDPEADDFETYGFRLIARLAPGVTIEQARAELATLVPSFRERHPTQFREIRRSPIPVLTLHEAIVGDVRATLLLLFGAVGLVLFIACTNVANLLLARAGAREKEIAVRLALGADRTRVIRQLLTESTLLGMAGGAGGLVATFATIATIVSQLPGQVPRTSEIGVDGAVLAFSAAVSVLAGLVFGMAPAIKSTRYGPGTALSESSRGASLGRGRHRLNNGLVVTEVALAMVLVISAGLMLKSFALLKRVDVGFRAESLVSLFPLLDADRFTGEQGSQYYESVLERVRAVPGVESATAIGWGLPMTSWGAGVPYLVEGQDIPDGVVSQVANFRTVTPEYFETMGIPLLHGRYFTTADHQDAPPVGIVNETFVATHWPDEDPLGKRLLRTDGTEWLTVIGVARNIQQHQLDQAPKPQAYAPVSQAGYGRAYVIARTAQDPTTILTPVREAVQGVDRSVPIVQVRTMLDVIDASLGNTRFYTTLFGAFAVLALLLGTIGVYGVMSYVTSQRTKEIGVRVALGAAPRDVIRSTLGRSLVPVLSGIGIGIAAAVGLTRLLAGMLFEVATTDPLIFGGVAAALAVTGLAASYLPALRASRVDPMEVLTQG